MSSPLNRRLLASLLTVLTFLSASVMPAAAESASLSGRVMEDDGFTPRSGVVVALVDNENRLVYRSEPSSDEGAFRIDSAPAGNYSLLAETDQGAFVASGDFAVKAGDNDPVALKLKPASEKSNVVMAPAQTAGADTAWWQWVIAGAIVATGLIVVSDSSSSDQPQASPMGGN